jgi:hypothetical protein
MGLRGGGGERGRAHIDCKCLFSAATFAWAQDRISPGAVCQTLFGRHIAGCARGPILTAIYPALSRRSLRPAASSPRGRGAAQVSSDDNASSARHRQAILRRMSARRRRRKSRKPEAGAHLSFPDRFPRLRFSRRAGQGARARLVRPHQPLSDTRTKRC